MGGVGVHYLLRENALSQITPLQLSDFWWLSKHELENKLFVGVGHHPPLREDDIPMPLEEWFHSLDEGMQLLRACKRYSLDFLKKWRSICNNTNVYRTLELFASNTGQSQILGPFWVDIDNENCENGCEENLDDALAVACTVVEFLSSHRKLSDHDMRVFFSGQKGFHIEVRPEALGIVGSAADQLKLSALKLQEIINHFGTGSRTVSSRGTHIDPVYGDRFDNYKLKHPYIRLHGSWNKWVGNDGIERARRKIELSLDKLSDSTAEEICAQAEKPE